MWEITVSKVVRSRGIAYLSSALRRSRLLTRAKALSVSSWNQTNTIWALVLRASSRSSRLCATRAAPTEAPRARYNQTQTRPPAPVPGSRQHLLHRASFAFLLPKLLKNNRSWPEARSQRPHGRLLLGLCACAHRRTPTMVELDGIEPTTPCLQSRCSPN